MRENFLLKRCLMSEIIQKRSGKNQPCFTKQTAATNFPALHHLHGLIPVCVGAVRGAVRGVVREGVRGGFRERLGLWARCSKPRSWFRASCRGNPPQAQNITVITILLILQFFFYFLLSCVLRKLVKKCQGHRLAQSIKAFPLGFNSGHDLRSWDPAVWAHHSVGSLACPSPFLHPFSFPPLLLPLCPYPPIDRV